MADHGMGIREFLESVWHRGCASRLVARAVIIPQLQFLSLAGAGGQLEGAQTLCGQFY